MTDITLMKAILVTSTLACLFVGGAWLTEQIEEVFSRLEYWEENNELKKKSFNISCLTTSL